LLVRIASLFEKSRFKLWQNCRIQKTIKEDLVSVCCAKAAIIR
jgi:hypothetical protein